MKRDKGQRIAGTFLGFELEFCLTKEAYLKIYGEGAYGAFLWNENHSIHLSYFHKLFNTEAGQQRIKEDLKAIKLSFIKNKKVLLNSFNKKEFSQDEYDFLQYIIMDRKV